MSERKAIMAEQLVVLARQLPFTILSGQALAILVTLKEWGQDRAWIGGWIGLYAVMTILRLATLRLFWHQRDHAGSKPAQGWGIAFCLSTLASGLMWCLYGALAYSPGDADHLYFIAIVLTGLSAGASANLASYPPAQLAFVVPAMGGFILRFLLTGGMAGRELALLGLAFVVIVALLTRHSSRVLRDTIRLRLDNERLTHQLRDGEQSMRRIVESAPMPLMVLSPQDGRPLFCNARAQELLGPSASGFADPVDLTALASEVHRHGPVRDREIPMRDPDGRSFWSTVAAIPLEFDGHAAVLAAFHDVSRHVRAESELTRAKAEAEAANSIKSDILAMVGHDVRTPLSGISNMADMLSKTQLGLEQSGMLAVIRHSAESLLGVVDDVLDFSKIEAGQMLVDSRPFVLRQLVEETAEIIAPRSAERGVEIILDIDPALPRRMQGDGQKLRQILTNLLNNAARMTERGYIRLSVEPLAEMIQFRIEDTGPGIPADILPKLFTPFAVAHEKLGRSRGGCGLGLSISKHLTELMGGSLSVQTRLGEGSRFTVLAPLSPLPLAEVVTPRLKGLKIGVLCATRLQRLALERILAAEGALITDSLDEAESLICDDVVVDSDLPALSLHYFHRLETDELSGNILRKPVRAEELVRAVLRLNGRPVAEIAAGAPAPQAWTPPERVRAERANAMVLVAEDNGVNRLTLSRMLDRLGIVYDIASDGQLALDRYRGGVYGLVLTDLHMPRLDGFELAQAIRRQEQEDRREPAPILALTADALPETAASCLKHGMQDYLLKPVSLPVLESVLKEWLPAAIELRSLRQAKESLAP